MIKVVTKLNGQSYYLLPDTPKDFVPENRLTGFANRFPDKIYRIHCVSEEFSAVCPKTGLPDIYTIELEYFPKDLLVELKSLKEFLFCFRNVGMFVEELTNLIADLFEESIAPRSLVLKVRQAIRGGIITTVEAIRGTVPDADDYAKAPEDPHGVMV